jgi:hypothetical protein
MVLGLKEQAKLYTQRDWVVLPVKGKVPLVKQWTHLGLATDDALDTYFSTNSGADGVGILCGMSSNGLLVLDIDRPELVGRFETEMTDMASTYTVTTPSGCKHFYFQSRGYAIEQRFDGIDLQYTGRQVVAPPSPGYAVLGSEPVKALSTDDFNRLYTWCATVTRKSTPLAMPTPMPTLLQTDGKKVGELIRHYRNELVARGSRNEALFWTAIHGRNHAMSVTEIRGALIAEFAGTPALRKHRAQSTVARLREARATIDSAYSRNGRLERSNAKSLTDAMRQKFAQNKQTFVWRCLDGLYSHYAPGTEFTRAMAIEALHEVLSHNFVVKALTSGVFAQKAPPIPPAKRATQLRNKHANEKNECYASRCQKEVKIATRGRKAIVYVMPSLDDIAKWLGIEARTPRYSTPMGDGLSSSKNARKALLDAKIRHTPGKYGNKFLSSVMGISVNTLKTYEKELGINRTASYDDVQIGVWNVDTVPWQTEKLMGVFIQDDNGKRYPAFLDVAKRLLGRGKTCWLRRQTASHLGYPEAMQKKLPTIEDRPLKHADENIVSRPKINHAIARVDHTVATPMDIPISKPIKTALDTLKSAWAHYDTGNRAMLLIDAILEQYAPQTPHGFTPQIDGRVGKMLDHTSPSRLISFYQLGNPMGIYPGKHIAKVIARHATSNQATSDKTDVVRSLLMTDGKHTLSRQKCHELFATYGTANVTRTAQFVAKRDGIKNPAGYLIECLKSDANIKKLKMSMKG